MLIKDSSILLLQAKTVGKIWAKWLIMFSIRAAIRVILLYLNIEYLYTQQMSTIKIIQHEKKYKKNLKIKGTKL